MTITDLQNQRLKLYPHNAPSSPQKPTTPPVVPPMILSTCRDDILLRNDQNKYASTELIYMDYHM